MDGLYKLDQELGRLARRYYLAHDVSDQFALAEEIAAHTIVETGFFEWESPLESTKPH